MNELLNLKFEDHPIRVIFESNQPWWAGIDVARALGYKRGRKAVADHVDPEDKRVLRFGTPSGTQTLIAINESGLYSLLLSSKLESAKRFKRWITTEVLPQIRQTGSYASSATPLVDLKQYEGILRAAAKVADGFPNRIDILNSLLEPVGINLPFPTVIPCGRTVSQDSIDCFLSAYGIAHLKDKEPRYVVKEYWDYCRRHGFTEPYSQNAFSYRLRQRYGIRTYLKHLNGKCTRVYRVQDRRSK